MKCNGASVWFLHITLNIRLSFKKRVFPIIQLQDTYVELPFDNIYINRQFFPAVKLTPIYLKVLDLVIESESIVINLRYYILTLDQQLDFRVKFKQFTTVYSTQGLKLYI